jgi:hypothetical protein
VVGPAGHTLSNAYCTIYAGASPATMPQPFISPYISNVLLEISFNDSVDRHIYTAVTNNDCTNGVCDVSNGGQWQYWGWWIGQ